MPSCNSILSQALVIILIGGAIGAADSLLRPIKLDRTISAPPPPPGPGPAPTPEPPKTGFVPTPADKIPKGQLTLDQAKTLFDQQAVFIDARKSDPFKAGHVKGAYRMAEEDFRFGNPPILAAIPRESTLIIYCSGGQCDESEQVARLLDGSGYKTIYVLHDGFPGWQAMGFPSETGEGIQ